MNLTRPHWRSGILGKEKRSCLTEGERYIFEQIPLLPMDRRYRKIKWAILSGCLKV